LRYTTGIAFFSLDPQNRYALAKQNKNLTVNAKGLLTFLRAKRAAGEVRFAAWLPAFAIAKFSLTLRANWLRQAVLDEDWTPPPIVCEGQRMRAVARVRLCDADGPKAVRRE